MAHVSSVAVHEAATGASFTLADEQPVERRSPDRVADEADWEAKVVARLHGRLKALHTERTETSGFEGFGWESGSLALLSRRLDELLR